MSEFQKYTDSSNFYCKCSEGFHGLLTTSNVYRNDNSSKFLYFGLTDGTNFKNNLKGINDKPIQLTCDQPDCDASVYHYQDSPDNDTGMTINVEIPKNTNTRYIKFSYNNTEIFRIRQIKKIIYIYTYKFQKITGQGDAQGNYDDYAYKYDLFLSNYLAFKNSRSDYMKITDKSIKITDLLFYYTTNNIAMGNDSIGQGTKLSQIKSSIGGYGWFYPGNITNDGYICHMETYSTTSGLKQLYKEGMPNVLFVLAVRNDNDNYIMGTVQKVLEVKYSYIN